MEDIINMINESWFRNEFYGATKEEQLKFISELMKTLSDLLS